MAQEKHKICMYVAETDKFISPDPESSYSIINISGVGIMVESCARMKTTQGKIVRIIIHTRIMMMMTINLNNKENNIIIHMRS